MGAAGRAGRSSGHLAFTEPLTYNFWPNGTSATLYDYFGTGAPPFQGSIIDANNVKQFFDLGFGSRFDADPQGLPDEPLTTCGIRFTTQLNQDPWGHPLEDNDDGMSKRASTGRSHR
jgi:hypothetical protein